MVTTSVLIGLCVITAIAALLVVDRTAPVRVQQRAATAPSPREKTTRNVVSITVAIKPPRPAMHKLHWVSAAELSRLITSDPDLVLFHLVDGEPSPVKNAHVPSQLAVSLQELEETLPWIPYTSRVAIYRNDGIDKALARKLSAVLHGREALLLSGIVPPIPENLHEMAGAQCN